MRPRQPSPPPDMAWQRGLITITCAGWRKKALGHLHRGLGLHFAVGAYDHDRFQWGLTHLRSGVAIATITGGEPAARAIAEKVAGLTDWPRLAHPSGWRRQAPDLDRRFRALMAEHPGALTRALPNGTSMPGSVT